MTPRQLAAQQRAALIAHEQATAQQMAYYYDQTWNAIQTRLNQLLLLIAQAKANGTPVKTSWLWEQNRLKILQGQIADQIAYFASYAEQLIKAEQLWAIGQGWLYSHELMQAALPKGIAYTFNHVPSWTLTHLVGRMQDGTPLSKRLARLGPDGAKRAGNILFTGVAIGQDVETMARLLKKQLAIPLNDSLRIARTEALGAYRDATLANYRANSDVVEEWEWSAAANACPEKCKPKDGKTFPLSTPMDEHPNGRCAMLPKTVSYDRILALAS